MIVAMQKIEIHRSSAVKRYCKVVVGLAIRENKSTNNSKAKKFSSPRFKNF
jgi:hypothetical protein